MATRFHWGLNGLNEPRFRAYSNLLSLRNGGQIDSPSETERFHNDENEGMDGDDDADTVVAQEITSFSNTKLKEVFQDRVAELVSNAKGGYHVAATLLIEWQEEAKLLVAKNETFKQRDRDFLELLQTRLRAIASTDRSGSEEEREKLWEEMMSYYDTRLQDWFRDLRQALKEFSKSYHMEPVDVSIKSQELRLSILHLQEIAIGQPELSPKVRLELVVQKAYNIRIGYEERDFLEIFANRSTPARQLRLSICFLGRLQTAFNLIVRAAERLSNFQRLIICPIGSPLEKRIKKNNKTKSSPSLNSWTLAQTFQSLQEPLEDGNIKLLIGQNWNKRKLLTKFEEFQRRDMQLHAEVQLIIHIAQNRYAEGSVSRYIGCSKRSCFLCWTFLNAYKDFRTRGCHGRLYNLWAIPETDCLRQQDVDRLVRAAEKLQRQLLTLIRSREHKILHQVKESTVGGSSIGTKTFLSKDPHTQMLISRHLANQRENSHIRALEKPLGHASIGDNDDDINIDANSERPETPPIPVVESKPVSNYCDHCEEWTDRRCSHCGQGWFCSQSCQNRMTVSHLFTCGARALTTADYLKDAILRDEIPDDPQTVEDFGFSRCNSWPQKTHLLGLYKGLLIYLEIRSQEVNQWRIEGTLTANIIKSFENLPEQCHGDYFHWFLKNKHILEDESLPRQSEVDNVRSQLEEARIHLRPEDSSKNIADITPCAKRDGFIFYAMILHNGYPHPAWVDKGVDLWYDFGFCICSNEYEERQLGGLYSKLVGGNKSWIDYFRSLGAKYWGPPETPTCMFDEFWLAYESGELIQLIDRYGLQKDRQRIQHLDTFLANCPGEYRPSVRRLRHLLALENTNFPQQVTNAAHEYGFSPFLSPRLTLALRSFYVELLTHGDPMELHYARRQCEVLKYAQRCLGKVDSDIARILGDLPRS